MLKNDIAVQECDAT